MSKRLHSVPHGAAARCQGRSAAPRSPASAAPAAPGAREPTAPVVVALVQIASLLLAVSSRFGSCWSLGSVERLLMFVIVSNIAKFSMVNTSIFRLSTSLITHRLPQKLHMIGTIVCKCAPIL